MILICLVLHWSDLSAQNLVPNYSFEDYSEAPDQYGDWWKCNDWDNVNGFEGWMYPFASPDYMHVDGEGVVQLPDPTFAHITPSDGGGIMGFNAYGGLEFREYISAQFITPMVPGYSYSVSFKITNGESDWYGNGGCDHIGLQFSTGSLIQVDHEPIGGTPQYEIPGIFWSDTWTVVSFTFIADAAYDRVTFGNFNDDASTSFSTFVVGGVPSAYYFLDEVVIVPDAFFVTIDTTICDGEFYTLPDGTLTDTAGVYEQTFITALGTDSTIITNLIVAPVYNILIEEELCIDDTYILPDGTTTNTSGIYIYDYFSISGCDSIVQISLNFLPVLSSTSYVTICDGEDYILPDGTIASSAGTYSSTILSIAGCDSTITTILEIQFPVTTTIDSLITTGIFVLPDGTTITEPGIYTVLLESAAGCDSTLIINLFFNSEFSVPNAFSPNNDGVNDVFHIFANGVDLNSFEIYSRWGQVVYSTISGPVEWDGTFNQKELEIGVYIYKASYYSEGDEKIKSGNITLVR